MDKHLQEDRANFSHIFNAAVQIAIRYIGKQHEMPPGRFIPDLPMTDIQEEGLGAPATLELFSKNYADLVAATNGPRYFGFVTGGSTPASVAGDWLVSAFDQNACGSNDSIAPQIEKQAIHFLRQLLGLDRSYYGSFVTGATMSNFVSLAIGRQWVGEQMGVDFSEAGLGNHRVKVISGTPHSSVIKSLSMLGIGRSALIKPATLADREAVDLAALEETLRDQQHPVIVVANAGTVNSVDFDDLEAIGNLKHKYQFWLHVDAAFGGFAALSPKFSHLIKGINMADSVTVDAHKWLNVPYDAAMQFTRHRKLQLQVFQNSAAYLGDPEKSPDYFHYTPENSRRWRALPAWFSLMAYGKKGHREIVERNCDLAFKLGEAIQASEHFKLLAPVRMNVVCFTLNESNLTSGLVQRFLAEIRDDGNVFFTPTLYKGVPGIRAAISNWQTQDSDIKLAVEVLNRIYEKFGKKETVETER